MRSAWNDSSIRLKNSNRISIHRRLSLSLSPSLSQTRLELQAKTLKLSVRAGILPRIMTALSRPDGLRRAARGGRTRKTERKGLTSWPSTAATAAGDYIARRLLLTRRSRLRRRRHRRRHRRLQPATPYLASVSIVAYTAVAVFLAAVA